MIMDKNLMFSADQDIKAISGSSTAVASTNTAVVGKADFGYKGMFLVVKLKEALLAAKTNGGADGAEFVKSDKLPEKDASAEERKAALLHLNTNYRSDKAIVEASFIAPSYICYHGYSLFL